MTDTKSDQMVQDIDQFLNKFSFRSDVQGEYIHPEIDKRIDMLTEELSELVQSVADNNLEEVIDALVDLTYIAIGTARLCNFDFQTHWNEVHRANMTKERGPSKRGHDFDVYKPDGWTAPNHVQYFKGQK